MMGPVLDDVAGELKGNSYAGKVNIKQLRSLAEKYRIRSIPAMILFKSGKEVNRYADVKS